MRAEPTVCRCGGIGRLAGAEQIYVRPVGWNEAPWWSDAQIKTCVALPLKVTTNGQVAFEGRLDKRDDAPEMVGSRQRPRDVVGSELKIKVK
jgi:hypothetical protein